MGDLEQEPETSFEMDVMCEDEEAFCLSDDNIAALKQLLSQVTLVNWKIWTIQHCFKSSNTPNWTCNFSVFLSLQLQQCKIENELCCLDLRTKIKALWERLHIPQEEREALSNHMVESKKRNMEAVRTLPHFWCLITAGWFYSDAFCLSSCKRSFSV